MPDFISSLLSHVHSGPNRFSFTLELLKKYRLKDYRQLFSASTVFFPARLFPQKTRKHLWMDRLDSSRMTVAF
jgi:hypothetical protein